MRLRSVLFLDFDNIWIALEREDPAAARDFCLNPQGWLAAVRQGTLLPFPDPDIADRTLLALKCYADPNLMQRTRSRPSFVRAGFSVVDCPPLTTAGKNSADIHMVLDAVELLAHPTHFDEFIILSADADFTPLLVKLRLHDRRTVVFSNHQTAAAYKSVAAQQLRMDEMLAFLSATPERPISPGPSRPTPATTAPVGAPERRPADPAAAARKVETMLLAVAAAVARSNGAIPLAMAAQVAQGAVANDTANWGGCGAFGKMLQRNPRDDLQTNLDRDIIFDPARFDPPSATRVALNALPTEFRELGIRLRSVLDCPLLSTAEMTAIFSTTADVLAAQAEFHLSPVGREVRDRLKPTATPVARAPINFILRGVQLGGFDMERDRSAKALAAYYVISLVNGFRMAGGELPPPEITLLEGWVGIAATPTPS